jgi:hypothetical protein
MDPMYPEVVVELIGQDGNVFNVIGRVAKVLKRAGQREAAKEFQNAAFACRGYAEVLQQVMRTVTVE